MVKKIQINLSDRTSYTLIALVSIILLGVGVYAYGTSSPSTFGHSLGEIAPPTGCNSGQVLSWSGTAWVCTTVSSSGGNVVTGTNPICPAGSEVRTRYWTTPSCSNGGGVCSLYIGWSGAPPMCESCADWERCHICASTTWSKAFCVVS